MHASVLASSRLQRIDSNAKAYGRDLGATVLDLLKLALIFCTSHLRPSMQASFCVPFPLNACLFNCQPSKNVLSPVRNRSTTSRPRGW